MKNVFICKAQEVELTGVPEVIELLPLGMVKSQKGDFIVDDESYAAMKRQFELRGLDIVLDYEHQTLKGVQAPAAGWVKELILTATGIAGRVEWTQAARQYLEQREYRYLSPVISVRKRDSKAMALHSGALTNTPAIDGMRPIVNSTQFEEGEDTMELLEELTTMLGLDEDSSPQQVLEALKTALAERKALTGTTTPPAAELVVANKAETAPTPLELEVLALKSKLADREADEVVQLALKAGQLSPAMKDWGKSYALKDPVGFANYLATAPSIVPMGLLDHTDTALKSPTFQAEELKICKLMGVSQEDVQQFGKGY